ncbi:MAG: ADP/ATP-dependent (S)-NAD(P)H-hydrate dehydratase [Planctomycetota bacterium]
MPEPRCSPRAAHCAEEPDSCRCSCSSRGSGTSSRAASPRRCSSRSRAAPRSPRAWTSSSSGAATTTRARSAPGWVAASTCDRSSSRSSGRPRAARRRRRRTQRVRRSPRGLARETGPIVVTPHPGEAARLLGRPVGASDEERTAAAREIALRVHGVCVLKGRGTIVTDGVRTYRNATGGPGLATGGSGDVLTGLLCAYLASLRDGFDAHDAACAVVGPRASGGTRGGAARCARRHGSGRPPRGRSRAARTRGSGGA